MTEASMRAAVRCTASAPAGTGSQGSAAELTIISGCTSCTASLGVCVTRLASVLPEVLQPAIK
jgi:hypothetical protein